MDGLGRVFNIAYIADGVWFPLRDADAVTFVCQLTAGDTFTVQEATTLAGAGAANLVTVERFWTAPPAATSAWTKTTQAAAATVITAAGTATHVAVFTVTGEELSAGFDYIRCSSTSTGTVTAILHDLNVQRAPEKLPAVSS